MSVWMLTSLNLDRFCKDVNIQVYKGVVTCNIRPAGRKDVVFTFVGLDFNTPDVLIK